MVYAKRRPLGGFRRLLALTGGRHARSMTINHLPAKPALKADEASQHPCQDEICDICRSITLSAEPAPCSQNRSEEHTSELQSLMRISYAVFCLKKKKNTTK